MIVNAPSLGLENEQFFKLITNPFDFIGEITMTSRDIDLGLDNIFYAGGPLAGQSVDFEGVESSDYIGEEAFAEIQSTVMGAGKLPAGTYIFNFQIHNEEGSILKAQTMGVEIANPSTMELIAPGGELEDNLEIYSLFPFFQWESEVFMWNPSHCMDCGFEIRVAAYDPIMHGSLEEAFNSDEHAYLPFPASLGYYKIQGEPNEAGLITSKNSFQYPVDARALVAGKKYVWDVKKTFPTTSGPEFLQSQIFVFSIPSMGGESESSGSGGSSGGSANQYLLALEQLLGSEQYNQMFSADLEGYSPTGVILLNDTQQLTLEQLQGIATQLISGQITIQSVTVE